MIRAVFYRAFIMGGLALIIYILKFFPNELVLSTLFTVASIFLSIGLSLIITFDYEKIKNDKFYIKIKKNIGKVRNTFLVYFGLIASAYLIGSYFLRLEGRNPVIIYLSETVPKLSEYGYVVHQVTVSVVFALILFGICYFIINFLALQKLKDEIAERIRNSHSGNV